MMSDRAGPRDEFVPRDRPPRDDYRGGERPDFRGGGGGFPPGPRPDFRERERSPMGRRGGGGPPRSPPRDDRRVDERKREREPSPRWVWVLWWLNLG